MKRVAVVGAGVMGRGIAELYALGGLEVRLCDVGVEVLGAAATRVRDDLSLLAAEGLVDAAEADAARGRITFTPRLDEAVHGAGFVTEAIPELLAPKQALFEQIEAEASPDAIIASNTSTLSIAQLAGRVRRPERMVITHFFNPAQLVPLVEVLAHPAAPPGVAEATLALMRRIGKRPVLLRREVPGFIANRLQAALAREAFHLLEEGVASAEEIDAAVTEGPGFRWAFVGPLAIADFGGLDTWQRVLDNLAPVLDRATGAPAAVIERVRRGELGAKTGTGIFAYPPEELRRRMAERDWNFARLLQLKRERPG